MTTRIETFDLSVPCEQEAYNDLMEDASVSVIGYERKYAQDGQVLVTVKWRKVPVKPENTNDKQADAQDVRPIQRRRP